MPVKALCVSIHDVAPATWPACESLARRVQEVARIPLTFLVVPAYHRLESRLPTEYEDALGLRVAGGDELALHGYVHLDEGPEPAGPWERFRRRAYTAGEGEFAAVGAEEAELRIERGLAWFWERGWMPEGFVAPAWLMSDGTWKAVRRFPFRYTTTLGAFHLLQRGDAVRSPSLVYSARNYGLTRFSCFWNTLLAPKLEGNPLVRLSLHPPDVGNPLVVRHFQRLLERLLVGRTPMTKAGFARLAAHFNPRKRPSAAAGTHTQSA